MNKEKINILIINNNCSEISDIKSQLERDMRVPWNIIHCISVEEARSRVNKADLVILKPEMEGLATAKEIFNDVEHMVFEIPIIVLTDESCGEESLSTYVMEKGAADTLIRGQFARLVDAIEFSLIRQKITTGTRKDSDKTLQDSKDAGDAKYTESCDRRLKDQEESKVTLSMFMGEYSVQSNETKKE